MLNTAVEKMQVTKNLYWSSNVLTCVIYTQIKQEIITGNNSLAKTLLKNTFIDKPASFFKSIMRKKHATASMKI